MFMKRCLLSVVAVFIFVFGFEWLFHGVLMADAYSQTASMWRTDEAMQAKFGWIIGGHFLFALMLTIVFKRGYENRGLLEGVRFGIIMALLLNAPMLAMYAVAPYPDMMVVKWVAAGFVKLIGVGLILAFIAKSNEPATPA